MRAAQRGGGVKGLYILFLSRTFWEDPEFVRILDISHLHSLHSDRRRWLKQNRKPLMKKLLHSAPSGQKLHRTPLSSGPNALKVYDTFWSTSRFKWLNTSQALWHTSNCQMRPSDQSGTSHWTLIWALTVRFQFGPLQTDQDCRQQSFFLIYTKQTSLIFYSSSLLCRTFSVNLTGFMLNKECRGCRLNQDVCCVFKVVSEHWPSPPPEETTPGGAVVASEGESWTSGWTCWQSAALTAPPPSFSSSSSELPSSRTNRFFMESATAALSSSSDSSKFLMTNRKLKWPQWKLRLIGRSYVRLVRRFSGNWSIFSYFNNVWK